MFFLKVDLEVDLRVLFATGVKVVSEESVFGLVSDFSSQLLVLTYYIKVLNDFSQI